MLRFSRMAVLALIAGAALASAGQSQTYTTAAEVKPILTATKPNWIALREYDGQDLLYFTNLLAWRCGLTAIRYRINANEPVEFTMEPCYEGEATPNALKMETFLIYVTLPLKSVETVTVVATFDDGREETGTYERAAVLTP